MFSVSASRQFDGFRMAGGVLDCCERAIEELVISFGMLVVSVLDLWNGRLGFGSGYCCVSGVGGWEVMFILYFLGLVGRLEDQMCERRIVCCDS